MRSTQVAGTERGGLDRALPTMRARRSVSGEFATVLERARRTGLSAADQIRARSSAPRTVAPAPTLDAGPRPTTAPASTRRTSTPRVASAPATAARPAPELVDSADAGPFAEIINRAATRHGVDPTLVAAVARAESSLNPGAVSHAGAKGLMQLMDPTARALGVTDSFDPVQNVEGGTRYLAEMLKRFGSTDLALAAYNAGPTAVARHGGVPPYAETQTYVRRVLENQQRLKEAPA